MTVLLVDIDSTIPNLALMKVSAYYRQGGERVGFNVENPDKAFISCIFKKNRDKALASASMLRIQYPSIDIDIGGPGFDLSKTLPREIEKCKPDYDLYPSIDYALGFTTRGCIRKCPFCIVPRKEGQLHRVEPIERIYDPRFSQIKLLDNNILADRENFLHIARFCIEHNLKVDVSQGLDARLLTPEYARILKDLRPMSKYVFAFDSLAYRPAVERAIMLLRDAGINLRSMVQFYVYCDRSIDGEYGFISALDRCNILRALGTNPYVMLDIDTEPTRDMRRLKRWANRKELFWSVPFEEYNTRKHHDNPTKNTIRLVVS